MSTITTINATDLLEPTSREAINTNFSNLNTDKAEVGQTFYIGTTQVAINRTSAGLTLAGITLTAPVLGVATATSINGNTFTTGTGTLTLSTFTLTVAGTASITGTNTGDQTSIVGITGTKAQFDTAVSDGNILYVGDITQYTDEMAQDAVGGMVDATLTYTDITPLLTVASAPLLTNARTIGGVSFNGSANITVASATGGFTVSGGDLAIGANNLTITGSVGATGARATKVWATDIESTNMPTVGGTAILTSLTAPQFTTIELGHATANTLSASGGILSIEGVAIPTISSTDELDNKTLDSSVGKGTWTASGTWTLPAFTAGGLLTLAANIQLGENTSIALDPAGSADGKYSGITIAGTLGATVAFGELVYLKTADSQWYLADADAIATSGNVLLGMCVLAGADNDATVILLQGNIRADAKFPALTVGLAAYAGETAGAIQVAIPTGADNIIRVVGFALTADELYFCPSPDHQTTVA